MPEKSLGIGRKVSGQPITSWLANNRKGTMLPDRITCAWNKKFTLYRRPERAATLHAQFRATKLPRLCGSGTIKQSPPEQIPCWRFAAGKEASTIHHTCNQRRDQTVECVKQGALPSAGPLRRHPVLPAGGTPSSPMEAPRPPRREAYVKQAAVVGYWFVHLFNYSCRALIYINTFKTEMIV